MRNQWLPSIVLAAASGLAALGTGPAHAQSGPNYKVVDTLPLVGDGNYDYLTFDDARGRLYVTRTGGVEVFDANGRTPRLVGTIPTMPSVLVNRAVLAPEQGLGFTSNNVADSTTLFSLSTLQVIGTFPLGQSTDAALYDPASGKGVFFSAAGNDALVYDFLKQKVSLTVPLGSAPEFAVVDAGDPGDTLFVNLPEVGQVARIDVAQGKVVSRFQVDAACHRNSGLAVDDEDHLLFIGCFGALEVMNARTGAEVALFPVGTFFDAIAYDPKLKTAGASDFGGALFGIRVASPSRVTLLGSVPTAPGGRTLAEDARNGRVFVAAVDFSAAPPGGQASTVPGTARILTLSP